MLRVSGLGERKENLVLTGQGRVDLAGYTERKGRERVKNTGRREAMREKRKGGEQ